MYLVLPLKQGDKASSADNQQERLNNYLGVFRHDIVCICFLTLVTGCKYQSYPNCVFPCKKLLIYDYVSKCVPFSTLDIY